MISQSCIYVGFISEKTKSEKPEIGKAPRFSSTRWSYEFYTALFLSGRSPALPDMLRAVIVNCQYLSDFWSKGTAFI